MKKVNKTAATPTLLDDYTKINPTDSWKQFKDNNGGPGDKQVKAALIVDQRGLCAYSNFVKKQ